MPEISNISARKILDSRSSWTIETTLALGDSSGIASVPGGTSRGSFEAATLDILTALEKVELLNKNLSGRDFATQRDFDNFLIRCDGTKNKSNLGGNTILSLSIAFAKALAKVRKIRLYQYIAQLAGVTSFMKPRIMMLIFEGGRHGEGSSITIQEFMVIVDAVDAGDKVYDAARMYLLSRKLPVEVGLEGAFSPLELDNVGVLNVLKEISPYPVALDAAATSSKKLPVYEEMLHKFNIVSIEDPYNEEDWAKWAEFNRNFGDKILVVGDDLIVTNPLRIKKAIYLKACNAVIIKPNQVGTVTETLESITLARNAGFKVIVSHRSGETNDSFIADLAAGVNADYVKFGAPSRGERVAKYNRLLEIFPDI